MLHVSIHAGHLDRTCRNNRQDFLNVGFETFGATPDRKIFLCRRDVGEQRIWLLKNYPRWGGTIADVVLRSIVLAAFGKGEAMPPHEPQKSGFAFAERLSVRVKDVPMVGLAESTVATMEIWLYNGRRGIYKACWNEMGQKAIRTPPFAFKPAFLMPCELVVRALAMGLTGSINSLPPRPAIYLPKPMDIAGQQQVRIHRIPEPLRTQFRRWILEGKHPVSKHSKAPMGAVPVSLFMAFISPQPAVQPYRS